jgi:transcriptional regulator with XRE-family HTH domain
MRIGFKALTGPYKFDTANEIFGISKAARFLSRQKKIKSKKDTVADLQRGERFMEAKAGQTIATIADAVGAAGSTVQGYTTGNIPSADIGIKISKYLNVDLDWWINGNGVTSSAPPSVVYLPIRGTDNQAISYSSGLIELLNRNVDSLFCTFGIGTMMHPTVPKDSELICSTDIHPLKDGCVYLVRFGNHEIIRRLRVKSNDLIEARCDNPAVQLEKADEVRAEDVIAEILWISHAPHG